MSGGDAPAAARLADRTIAGLLDDLAAATPTPGGGASAAIAGATAAAQAAMVAAFAVGKSRYAEHTAVIEAALAGLGERRHAFLDAADADARAYGTLNRLWSAPADDPDRVAAVHAAIAVPSGMIDHALEVLAMTASLVGRTSPMLASDLEVAALLARAAAESAACSVRINLPQVAGDAERTALADDLEARLQEVAARCRRITQRDDG